MQTTRRQAFVPAAAERHAAILSTIESQLATLQASLVALRATPAVHWGHVGDVEAMRVALEEALRMAGPARRDAV